MEGGGCEQALHAKQIKEHLKDRRERGSYTCLHWAVKSVEAVKDFHGLISRTKTSPSVRQIAKSENAFHGLISRPLALALFARDPDCFEIEFLSMTHFSPHTRLLTLAHLKQEAAETFTTLHALPASLLPTTPTRPTTYKHQQHTLLSSLSPASAPPHTPRGERLPL